MHQTLFLDAHIHLQDRRFDGVREAALMQAKALGVKLLICNGVSEKDWSTVAALAEDWNIVQACFGVHPWYADSVQSGWKNRLERFMESGVGVGEIGLDGACTVDAACQERVFRDQLALARSLAKPVVVHCLRSWGRLVQIVHEIKPVSPLVFHSYSGSKEIMFRLLELGGYFSFSGALSHPKRQKLRDIFLSVPLDRLLLETDGPDQFPFTLFSDKNMPDGRQSVNEPCNVVGLYRYAAQIRRISLEDLAGQVWNNGQIFTH